METLAARINVASKENESRISVEIIGAIIGCLEYQKTRSARYAVIHFIQFEMYTVLMNVPELAGKRICKKILPNTTAETERNS